jgi:preprotein translocase subunit YajC
MHLHLSLPDHLAVGAEHITASDGSVAEATSTTAASSEDDGNDPSAFAQVLSYAFPLLLVAAAYFLWLRPRTRRMREQQAAQRDLRSNTAVGDEVLLTSGVYGFVTGIDNDDDIVWVEIDDDVQIRVSRDAILRRVTADGAPSGPEPATHGDGATSSSPPAPSSSPSGRPTLKGRSKSAAPPAEPAAPPADAAPDDA